MENQFEPPLESTEIATLIRRSLAGDERGFEALFAQYKNLVFKTAFMMLGSVDEANDVLQDVFLNVHRSLATYASDKAAFSTWLYRITVNICLSWKRKKRLFFLSFDECKGNLADSRALHDANSRAHEEQAESADQVLHAMGRLSPKLRVVVVLRYYRDLSYAEIAVILNIPIGTVKSRLGKALTILRVYLTEPAASALSANLLTPEISS